ncbi:hypothetical protein [Pedobacter aquatilis]|uniref:hypothetical protein n=1 Tax=Pedobacter aquatilis TaxID=351343 RepID=UPI002931C393|nr:hypothetical protein [Pedobacter aquatilis]
MGLIDIFKEKTPLDEINNSFQFLTSEFGFQLVKTEYRKDFKAKHFLVYRNDSLKLQLEICGDTTWFHCEIRRLINGQPAKYSNKDNCISFEELAILESNNNYEHFDYYAGSSTGLHGVLINTANLFKRYKKFLTTDNWIKVKQIEQLKGDDFEKKFGKRFDDHNMPTFFGEVKKHATKLLIENGYKLLVDSDELSPFDRSGMVDYFTFAKDNRQIKVTQVDWRDDYFIYRIEVNGSKVFEIDIRNQDISKAVDRTLGKLKQQYDEK